MAGKRKFRTLIQFESVNTKQIHYVPLPTAKDASKVIKKSNALIRIFRIFAMVFIFNE